MAWLARLLGTPQLRVTGRPPSRNGASSFHLRWHGVPRGAAHGIVAAAADLEVVTTPAVDDLYFWALQASFTAPDGGAAHLGLQHNRRYPDFGAVNWGGYAPRSTAGGGGLLAGTMSPLPSTPGDANTRDFSWRPGRRYRLRIERGERRDGASEYAWAGSVEDAHTGVVTHVRHLFSPGMWLDHLVVWTECFAACDAPPVQARWSNLSVTTERWQRLPVTQVVVSYQPRKAGGCDNTNAMVDGAGWLQETNSVRSTPPGSLLTPG